MSAKAARTSRKGWLRQAMNVAGDDKSKVLGEWIAALLQNAADLLAEADLLFDAERYPRAMALAHFAMEEMGKVWVLVSILVQLTLGSEPDWMSAERMWSSHDAKFQLFHLIDVLWQVPNAKALADDIELLKELEVRLAGRPLREASLYVDIEDGGSAVLPATEVDEGLAKLYLGTAFHSGKTLIDTLMTMDAGLDKLAENTVDPIRRRALEHEMDAFIDELATARLKARKSLVEELSEGPETA